MGRSVMARKLLDFFTEQGYILSPKELNDADGSPVRMKHIRRAWGTYRRCLNAIAQRYPSEWAEIEGSDSVFPSALAEQNVRTAKEQEDAAREAEESEKGSENSPEISVPKPKTPAVEEGGVSFEDDKE